MERKKQRISDLFYDNRFLMVFSVLFALIAWLIVATEFAETQNTIYEVPIEINISNVNNNFGGLEQFPKKNYYVDVTISGKRYIVESENIKDDILVVADTSLVNSPGKYQNLALTVSSRSVRPEYEFVSISSLVIDEITFDYFKEDEFKIETDITYSEDAVPDGYQLGEFVVSDVSKVKVSGPATEFNKVARVVAKAEYNGEFRKSTSVDATLYAVDKNNVPVQGVDINRTSDMVTVKIPVYIIQQLPIKCSFSNIPSEYIGNFPFEYSVEPSLAMFGIFDEDVEKTDIELVSKIDFSKLQEGKNVITLPISTSDFSGGILLDESITELTVTVNIPEFSSKTVQAMPENIKNENLPSNVDVEISELNFNELIVIGPSDKLLKLNKDNIVLIADFTNCNDFDNGTVTVPVRVDDGYCWSYGEYKATFNVL